MVNKLIVAASFTFAMSLSAQAAPVEFCREYATAAVNQVRAGLANPRCAAGIRGPRWTPNGDVHFQWCLRQPVPLVESERGARTAYLHACRG
ncbi:MAG: hypothetical protein KGL96_07935 [Hyphomicrobiales bacterium]|nr:hypothetical protein [Hyphomicrobiales bacterium]